MNFNCFILLRILVQGKFTAEELLKYLSINLYSLQRNIKSINSFLSSLNITEIEKNTENYFYLELTEEEKNRIFKNLNLRFSQQREDYLFLKILISGFTNLENEAKFLNISRSTIVRDFASVKDILNENRIKTKYKSGRGIFIENNTKKKHYRIALKIMKIILERSYTPTELFDFIPELSFENIKKEYQKLYKISEHLKLQMGEFVFSSVYSLIILNKYFKNIKITLFNKRLKVIEGDEKFFTLKKYLSKKIDVEENVLNYIASILYDVKYNSINFSFFVPYNKKFIAELKKHFKLNEEISPKIERAIHAKLLSSSIRYSNRVMYISTLHPTSNDKIIIDIVEKILSDLNVKYYYGDILQIIQIVKTLLIEHILSKKIRILFLIQEYLMLNTEEISNKVRKISSNIDFEMKPTIYYEYLDKDLSGYDLIISDQLNLQGINRIKILNLLELDEVIYEFCIEKAISAL